MRARPRGMVPCDGGEHKGNSRAHKLQPRTGRPGEPRISRIARMGRRKDFATRPLMEPATAAPVAIREILPNSLPSSAPPLRHLRMNASASRSVPSAPPRELPSLSPGNPTTQQLTTLIASRLFRRSGRRRRRAVRCLSDMMPPAARRYPCASQSGKAGHRRRGPERPRAALPRGLLECAHEPTGKNVFQAGPPAGPSPCWPSAG